MTNYLLDPEILRSWEGLETYDGYKIKELLTVGSQQVVYRTMSKDGKKFVLKIPKSHIGFVIELPPNTIFRISGDPKLPHNSFIQVLTDKDVKYEEKLNSRLVALCGSPLLSSILPLESIWKKLAFDLVQATWHEFRDYSHPRKSFLASIFSRKTKKSFEDQKEPKDKHFARLERHKALIHSNFIMDILHDWTSIDYKTNPNEIITIHAGGEPIHASFPKIFVEQASYALQNIDALFDIIGVITPKSSIEKNPFLPFIAAFSSGYELSNKNVVSLVKLLDQQIEIQEILLQLGQILHFLTPKWNRKQKSQIITFIMEIGSQSNKIGLEELMLCVEELK
jgi:hypothetical protein